MKLTELVNTYHHNLNENDQYIWNYIEQHKHECEQLSIDDLASRCAVSRTTILRFAKKLSLKGYGELKVYLKWENSQSNTQENYIDEVVHIYHNLIDTIREHDFTRLFENINGAHRLFVFGSGAVQSAVANEIKRIFQTSGLFFYTIGANDEADVMCDIIQDDDLVFLISLSGESNHIKEFAKRLKIKDIPIVSITKEKDNALAHMADENLYITTFFTENGGNQVKFETSTSFFILIEMLYLKYLEYMKVRGNQSEN